MNKVKVRYFIDKEVFDLSLEEHESVMRIMDQGDVKMIRLRGGLKGFNLSYYKHHQVLPESVEEEAKGRLGNGYTRPELLKMQSGVYEELAERFNTDKKLLT